ncbi:TRAP transporter large permease subunit [candidate division KSB1 bacterium]|nr:MAG: TRAP transporter large permease subunit [candidate division KSB1 bacterium]MCE7940433.1 TRAP transporter large permease subunit [Chlorobi bacterium CHB1]MDL1873627.1 SLC13 family permease [Cytophagia bacterium CHB2]
MTFEIAFVLVLVILAVILFATEKLPVDLVALLVMGVLLVSGIISPEEGIAGFSNTATVTVGAMFVLSAGLFKTGAVNHLGRVLSRLFKLNLWLALFVTMLIAGGLSAFINNTPVVAIFLPLLLGVARDLGVSPSKLLMPLSFASMFGGVCTLIGTSTNILVSAIAERHGQPTFGMFEFTRMGAIFFAAGILYMIFIGIRLIPDRRGKGDLMQTFGMGDYLIDVVLLPEAESVGKSVADSPLVKDLDLDILEVQREDRLIPLPTAATVLQANDVLRVRCEIEKIKQLQERKGIILKPEIKWRDEELESEEAMLVEAVIAPNSVLDGKTLKDIRFRNYFGGTVLALRHRGATVHEKMESTTLRAGDVLLVKIRRDHLIHLEEHEAFLVVSEVGLPTFRKSKAIPAIAIVAGVVLAAAFNIIPIVSSAIAGAILMILVGCLDLEEAYKAIEWKVIFLLAGVLSLGAALEKTGAALLVSDALIAGIGPWGPLALLAALFLLTTVLTNVMSNNATAALLAPIALAASESLGLSPRPLLMAVTFAASLSFMTPVGYQTNTLIYGPGQYKFADFLRAGTLLNLLFWILAILLIPKFWPF